MVISRPENGCSDGDGTKPAGTERVKARGTLPRRVETDAQFTGGTIDICTGAVGQGWNGANLEFLPLVKFAI